MFSATALRGFINTLQINVASDNAKEAAALLARVAAGERDRVLTQQRSRSGLTPQYRQIVDGLDDAPLRRRPSMTASSRSGWGDRIIPLRMEYVSLDIECDHLGIADLDTLRIAPRVEFAAHREALVGRLCADQFDDRHPIAQ